MGSSKEKLNRLRGYENRLYASCKAIGGGINRKKAEFQCCNCKTDNVKVYVEGWKYVVFTCSECHNYETPPIEKVATAELGEPELREPNLFRIKEQ